MDPVPSRVRIEAPSHVHAGNIDIHGGVGRLYGTVGFTLETPSLILEARRVEGGVRASGWRAEEAERYAERALKSVGCEDAGVEIRVKKGIPSHVGLGSTTALAMSSAYAALTLCGIRRTDPVKVAEAVGRGVPSALGVYSFAFGGFIVDGGFARGEGRRVPPLIFRAHVPSSVSIVVALPSKPVGRVLEVKRREAEVLESMPPMPERIALEASRIIVMGVMPAASEGRWDEAARLLHRFNKLLGEYWSREQGGIYCCAEAEILIEEAVKAGAWGALQSSWGPTVYAITSRRRAGAVAKALREAVDAVGGGEVWVSRVNNTGARLEVLTS